MPAATSIQNLHVLLSHRTFYGTSRSVDSILNRPISQELLCMLSILAFESSEEKRFRSWAASSLPVSSEHRAKHADEMNTRFIFGRIQIFDCWKQVLARAGTLTSEKQNRVELAGTLHELLALLNDRTEDEDIHHYLVKSAIHTARDDYHFKLYRAQKIFVDGKNIAPYVTAFEEQQGFKLETYLEVIVAIATRCNSKRREKRFDPLDLDGWYVDLNEMHKDMKIELGLLSTIMNSVAFTLDEGIAFAAGTVNDTANFNLFRSRPFLKLSETCFLPIEGKLVEELLFDNLFHRLHFASGLGVQFFTDVGRDFERYTQNLIADFCTSGTRITYEYIPEFSYGKSSALSPDAMVRCEQNKSVIVFEVKSARYLDRILTSKNDPQAVVDSLEKLKYKPWEQMHDAIETIVAERRHDRLEEGFSFLFVAVTMNEIPHSLQDYTINIHGQDRSYCFYSFGIHALELLLTAASLSDKYTLYDILRNAFNERHRISNRTAFLRFLDGKFLSSPFYINIRRDVIHKMQDFVEKRTGEPGGSTQAHQPGGHQP